MTNQNPASSKSPSNLDRDILAKLSAHADRSLDRLFTDIDELLSGDLEPESKSASANLSSLSPANYSIESFRAEDDAARQNAQSYRAQVNQSSPQLTAEVDPPQSVKSQIKQQPGLPLWLKTLLGLGVTSIALSSLFFWLVNQRKIAIPQNIDTSWIPLQSQSQVSPADAKFAGYMQKSIAKIEATASLPATTNLPNPADIALPTPTTPYLAPPTQSIVTTAPKVAPTAIKKPILLVKILKTGSHSTAVFQLDSKSQTIKIGQKIGTSNWSLMNVSKGEVTVKGKGGEIRSIKIGQKF